MRVPAQSRAMPNVFNAGNVVKQLIWTRVTLGSRPNESAGCYDNDNQSCQFPIPGCPVHGILLVLNLAVPLSSRSLLCKSLGHWPFFELVWSSALRRVFASLTASSIAQKCM